MLSIAKMKALWSVFEEGKAVADPAKWRGHQVSANMIAGFLFAVVSLLKAWGYDIGIDMQTCADIGVGLLAAINAGITIAASKEHGLPARAVREAQPSVPATTQAAEQPATMANDEAMSHVSEASAGQQATSIDEATRQRALEWVRQHSVQPNRFDNGLANDA